ncbi:MAG: site-specific DNA-methyltransferase [Oscillospiraceae bacterium]
MSTDPYSKSQIIAGDALNVLSRISDGYIDCCITSPPYYALRDYGVEGQIGLENSIDEYIGKLVEIFREVHRVLRDDGTLWVNIADTYAGSGKGRKADGTHSKGISKSSDYCGQTAGNIKPRFATGIKKKELCLIPQRLAIALQADGWYIRQDIIWSKPNAMPESVKDRCTKSHEYIFLLTKQQNYYFDGDVIKEPCVGFDNRPPAGGRGTLTPNSRRRKGNAKSFRGGGAYTNHGSYENAAITNRESHGNAANETGLRNRRSVWSVATKGYSGAHFATFPEKLIEPCILAGCRIGGIVLDPFFGSGTVGVVAKKHERCYLGIELNPEYVDIAKQRIGGEQNVKNKDYGRE